MALNPHSGVTRSSARKIVGGGVFPVRGALGFLFRYTIVYFNPSFVKTIGIIETSEVRWCPGAESNHRHEDFQQTCWPKSYLNQQVVRAKSECAKKCAKNSANVQSNEENCPSNHNLSAQQSCLRQLREETLKDHQ